MENLKGLSREFEKALVDYLKDEEPDKAELARRVSVMLEFHRKNPPTIEEPEGVKCPRCWKWHYVRYNFDNLCDRCQEAIIVAHPNHESVWFINAFMDKQSKMWKKEIPMQNPLEFRKEFGHKFTYEGQKGDTTEEHIKIFYEKETKAHSRQAQEGD